MIEGVLGHARKYTHWVHGGVYWVAGYMAAPAFAGLEAEIFATGFTNPIFVTSPPGDPRLFVVEQRGTIQIIENGMTLGTPFLDIQDIVAAGGERGLLGLAFHPDYASNGFFYVHYSNERVGSEGDTVVSRFSVSGNPNVADDLSELILIEEDQPFANHNGGMIAFRPGDTNHFLYIALGDGGSAGDPDNRAQNLDLRLGKMLRIDVDQELAETPAAGNPFIGVAGNDFIWSYGLRNPWRFSFDRLTGDMYIGDVGQNAVEEIDFEAAASAGGVNYGWRLLEGTMDHNCTNCDQDRMNTELPIHEYGHIDGISVTGGYVYRGSDIPSLQGTYFFGDLTGRIWSLRYDGATVTEFMERTSILPSAQTIVSFGEDSDGEMYIVGHGGTIFRLANLAEVLGTTGGRVLRGRGKRHAVGEH